MSENQRIQEIEERTKKASKGPWIPCERGAENPVITAPEPFKEGSTANLLMMYWPAHEAADTVRAEKLWYDTIEFIAHAREDIPYLIDRLQDAERELVNERAFLANENNRALVLTEKLEAAETLAEERLALLKELEWASFRKSDEEFCCLICRKIQRDGHAEDCRLAKALNPPQVGTKGDA